MSQSPTSASSAPTGPMDTHSQHGCATGGDGTPTSSHVVGPACAVPKHPPSLSRKSSSVYVKPSSVDAVSWLVGTWRGTGKGEYPTLNKNFAYTEEIVLCLDPSNPRPVLQYRQRSWTTQVPPKLMHVESGWVRVLGQLTEQGHQRLEVVLSAQNGVTTVEEGYVRDHTINLHSTSITRSSTARAPYATEFHRRFEVDLSQDPPVLHYTMDMATTTTPQVTRHLEAWLTRSNPDHHHHHHQHAASATEVPSCASSGDLGPGHGRPPCHSPSHMLRNNSSSGGLIGMPLVHGSPRMSGGLLANSGACPFTNGHGSFGHAHSPLGSPAHALLGGPPLANHHSMTGSHFSHNNSCSGSFNSTHAMSPHPLQFEGHPQDTCKAAVSSQVGQTEAGSHVPNGVHPVPPAVVASHPLSAAGFSTMPHANGVQQAYPLLANHEQAGSILSRHASVTTPAAGSPVDGSNGLKLASVGTHAAAAAAPAQLCCWGTCPRPCTPPQSHSAVAIPTAGSAAQPSQQQQVGFSSVVPCSLDAALGRLSVGEPNGATVGPPSFSQT